MHYSLWVLIDDFVLLECPLAVPHEALEFLVVYLRYMCRSPCSGRSCTDSLAFDTCNYHRCVLPGLLHRLWLVSLHLMLCCPCSSGSLFAHPSAIACFSNGSAREMLSVSSSKWGLLTHHLIDDSNLRNYLILQCLWTCDAYCSCAAWQLSELSFIYNELEWVEFSI